MVFFLQNSPDVVLKIKVVLHDENGWFCVAERFRRSECLAAGAVTNKKNVLVFRVVRHCGRDDNSLGNRENHPKNRAFAERTFHFDGSAKQLRVFVAKRQPDARATLGGFVGASSLKVAVEQVRQVIGVDARAGVDDRQLERAGVQRQSGLDAPTWRWRCTEPGDWNLLPI